MTNLNLQQWIQHPEMLNKDTLYELRMQLTRSPYSQTLRLLYLKNLFLLHDISFGAELRKATIYITDRTILFYLLEGDTIYPLQSESTTITGDVEIVAESDRTLTLIDAFLANLPEETTAHTGFDYATDYTSYLIAQIDEEAEQTEPASKLKGFELIDGFIEHSETNPTAFLTLQNEEVLTEEITVDDNSVQSTHLQEDEDDSCFTETLAKIYIKQRKYSKALEIIKKLSLKYPKKNAYFADQIRFLDKLIINAKSK